MPSPDGTARGFLRRLATLLLRPAGGPAPDPAARARWPHLRRGWLDPDVLLHGWRTTIDVRDAGDALRAIASASGKRLGEGEAAEILDFLAQLAPGEARAFRFGREGPNAFAQIWIGLLRSDPQSVRLFLLADQGVVDDAQEALSVGGFAGDKRAEYDELSRFFLAFWEWRRKARPAGQREGAPAGREGPSLDDRMRRVLSDRSAPFLELLRGLRTRVGEIVAGTKDYPPAEAEAADAFLAERGAPTLAEMRRRPG